MSKVIQSILEWSEVWALIIPLVALLKYKPARVLKPVAMYVWLALLINIPIDIAYKFKTVMPSWLWPNNYLYNIHSIIRFACFSSFFLLLHQPYLKNIKKLIPVLSFICLAVNFIFFENFFTPNTFSSRLLATEAAILLFYCLQYFLFKLLQDDPNDKRGADFWVVTGLSIYVVFNFPYFLLYTSLDATDQLNWWNIHNVSYIILCIFISKAFYVSGNRH